MTFKINVWILVFFVFSAGCHCKLPIEDWACASKEAKLLRVSAADHLGRIYSESCFKSIFQNISSTRKAILPDLDACNSELLKKRTKTLSSIRFLESYGDYLAAYGKHLSGEKGDISRIEFLKKRLLESSTYIEETCPFALFSTTLHAYSLERNKLKFIVQKGKPLVTCVVRDIIKDKTAFVLENYNKELKLYYEGITVSPDFKFRHLVLSVEFVDYIYNREKIRYGLENIESDLLAIQYLLTQDID